MNGVYLSSLGVRKFLDAGHSMTASPGGRLCRCRKAWIVITRSHYEPRGEDGISRVLDDPSETCRLCGFTLLPGFRCEHHVGQEPEVSFEYRDFETRCSKCHSETVVLTEKDCAIFDSPIFDFRRDPIVYLGWHLVCATCGHDEVTAMGYEAKNG